MPTAIQARDLTRNFKTKAGPVEAVRGVSFDIAEGELVAFLGPNGAGKSTATRMLTTLLPPSSGAARIAGHDVLREPGAVRRKIGYVGQGTGSGPYHRVLDELLVQGAAQRMDRAVAKRRAAELLGMLELDGLEKRDCSSLSGGQKRRLDVALGLMHTPQILFLDEPTTGLDPHSRANLWEHITKLRKQTGMTIFLTTHYLDEADSMAERVMIIDAGKIIADDTPEKLKANLGGDTLDLRFGAPADAQSAAALASNVPGAREIAVGDNTLSFVAASGEALLPRFIREAATAGIDVASANVRRPTLDNVFLSLTGRSLREQAAA
ncbi:MAG: ATP-binding cassette domain-containing protein [Devosia sp.]